MTKRLYFLLFLFLIHLGCTHEEPFEEAENQVLISQSQVLIRTSGDLKTFLSGGDPILNVDEIIYDVTIHKIEYEVNYKGENITASGLVFVPDTDDPMPVLSFQHGTIAAHSQAPSAQPLSSTEWILYAGIAGSGYVMVVPDFIGFGSSDHVLHPYYVEEPSADAVIRMLEATLELSDDLNISLSHDLFLGGYSQGGYVTLAAHKEIETNPIERLELIKSYPAAGGYLVKDIQEYFFSLSEYHQPFFIGYVTEAYRDWYGWTEPHSMIFQSPYAERMPQLFDGSLNGNQINAQLTTSIPELLQPDIIADIDDDPGYTFIREGLIENSLDDFIPAKPLAFYHGTADVTVPYQNSLDYISYLRANGLGEDKVTFTPIEAGTHISAVPEYIQLVMEDMKNVQLVN